MGKPALTVIVRRNRLSTYKSVDMGTVEGTKAIAKVRSVLWTLCDAEGYRVVGVGLLDDILVEEEEGVEDGVEGSK